MYLRTLTLRGFKSFASATTLHLEPGITCVVGPNGSGKSNVVDALAWVMGEQGAKSLRGGSMADVIFAGTPGRPPLGRAEVSLTIDNADGALPIDYREVTLTRTLFRGGGSEYAINGTACRLLDVQELLADSGIGREMHVVVGQGRLDAVLSAGPEERRGFIEEAAGVLKHRKRKEKALRKLDATAANLARLTDLATEIGRRLGPLARQADAARRAQVVQADLRDARARLLADDVVQVSASLAHGATDERRVRETIDGLEAEATAARERLATLEQATAVAAPLQAAVTDAGYRLAALRDRFEGTRTVAAERGRLLGSTEPATTGRDPDDLAAEAGRARARAAEVAVQLDVARSRVDARAAARRAAEAEEASADADLARAGRAVADRREGVARLAGAVASRRGRLEAAEAELARLGAARDAAHERAAAAQREYVDLERQVAGQELGEEGLDAAHEQAAQDLTEAQAALAAVEADEREAESARATWAARRDALALSLARSDGTATFLSVEPRPAGVLGPLARQVVVAPGYAGAVAAALGTIADAAVVTSLDAAVDAVRFARSTDTGAVRLVVSGAPGRGSARPLVPRDARWAADLVRAEPPLESTLRRVLADVVVVADLAAAHDVVASADVVAVTVDGEVLTRTRASGGGTARPSVLELHTAHDEAAAELEAATRRCERVRFALPGARSRLGAAREAVAQTLDALHTSDAALAAVAERLGLLGSTVRAARGEEERLAADIARVQAEAQAHRAALDDLAERLAQARRTPDLAAEDVAAATARRDEALARTRRARVEETEACLEVRTLEERARSLAGRVAALGREEATERLARGRAAEEARRRAAQAEVGAAVLAGTERALAAIERSIALAAGQRERAEADRLARAEEVAGVRVRLDDALARLASLTDAAHRAELASAEHRLRLEALGRRAHDELGAGLDELVAQFGPDVPVPVADGEPVPYVREQQEQRLRTAERAIARLGRVNPLALEEHAALVERHRFLTDQLGDLRRSRADLLRIVAEIDERVERAFADAFADTAREFEAVFARLFPGGEGRLVLTEPGDMLATGVDVEARPPGKRVKRLSLLSGGERSLTAVALLVAIFKARPSPFYVMDEVEAALDDVNLGRLLEIFTELRASSQLVVVTHSKRTMEIADALYGVTMHGDGVTTVVSQRLRQGAAVGG